MVNFDDFSPACTLLETDAQARAEAAGIIAATGCKPHLTAAPAAAGELLAPADAPRIVVIGNRPEREPLAAVVDTLRESAPGRLHIIALIDTGDEAVAALAAGADDFIRRPVDPGELRARILHAHCLLDGSDHFTAGLPTCTPRWQATIMDSIEEVATFIDADMVIRYANPAAARVMGVPLERFVGSHCYELLYNRTDICPDCPAVEAMTEGTTVRAARRRPDGRILDRVVYPIPGTDGKPAGVAAIATDATQRVTAETALRHSEASLREIVARTRTLLNSSPAAIIMLDRGGKVLDCNILCTRRLGRPREEVVGHCAWDLVDEPFGARTRPLVERVFATGTPLHREETRQPGVWNEYSINPMIDDTGIVRSVTVHALDISERKRMTADRERLTAAIQQAGDAVVITDVTGNIRYVNPAFEAVSGYTAAEAVGKNPRMLNSGTQDEAFYRDLWQTITRGHTWKGRMVNRRKDGTPYTEDASIAPVRDESGTIFSFVAVKRDVTDHLRRTAEREELEGRYRQAEKLESIGRLAGGVAHDLNNLLSPIVGFAELTIEDLSEADPRRGNIQQILDAGIRAGDLVRQLLIFSRKQPQVHRRLDLNRVITDFGKLLRRTIRENIAIDIGLAPSVPPVSGNAGQLEQVIMNLAVNAQDAMPDGGTLAIETGMLVVDRQSAAAVDTIAAGSYVIMTVRDTGTGIDPEIRAHIFEPFYTTKESGKGTGLGLATVYGVVRQHRGHITVTSEPGRGTAFTILLPPAEREPPAATAATGGEPATANTGAGTILLAEDNELVRNLAKNILRRRGFDVLTAQDGTRALALAGKYPGTIDLLLTDVVMPDINGRELFERLRESRPALRVLYMSGYADDVISRHGVLDTGVDLLPKPFTAQALATRIAAVLTRRPDDGKGHP
ncbi:MAG: PAS domain S-box protein [Deltaproteobacteria bacterium]|nr:PAS domain S-box protein [Candidatus Anaeroferrophillacea bacterium]